MRYCALAACILLSTLKPAAAINPNAGTTGFNFLKIGVGTRAAALGRGLCGRIRQYRSIGLESRWTFRFKRTHGRARLQQLFRRFPSRLRLYRRSQRVARTRPKRPLRILRRLVAYRCGRTRFRDLLGDRPRRLSVHRPTTRAGLASRRCQSKSRLFKHRRVFFRRLSRRSRPPSPRPDRGHDARRGNLQPWFCALGLYRGIQGLATGSTSA